LITDAPVHSHNKNRLDEWPESKLALFQRIREFGTALVSVCESPDYVGKRVNPYLLWMVENIPSEVALTDHSQNPMLVVNDRNAPDLMPRHSANAAFQRVVNRTSECLSGHAVADLRMRNAQASRYCPDGNVSIGNDPYEPIGFVYNRNRPTVCFAHQPGSAFDAVLWSNRRNTIRQQIASGEI